MTIEEAPQCTQESVAATPVMQDIPATQASFIMDEPHDVDEKRPRLAIKKMVLENFKSYAGRVEVGPFHKVHPRSHAL